MWCPAHAEWNKWTSWIGKSIDPVVQPEPFRLCVPARHQHTPWWQQRKFTVTFWKQFVTNNRRKWAQAGGHARKPRKHTPRLTDVQLPQCWRARLKRRASRWSQAGQNTFFTSERMYSSQLQFLRATISLIVSRFPPCCLLRLTATLALSQWSKASAEL